LERQQQARGSGSTVSSQLGSGQSPDHFGHTKSAENVFIGLKCHLVPFLDSIRRNPWMPLTEPLGAAEPLHCALNANILLSYLVTATTTTMLSTTATTTMTVTLLLILSFLF